MTQHAEDDCWPRKIRNHQSTAKTVDAEVEALLAQAELIKDNPDRFLPDEAEITEAELV